MSGRGAYYKAKYGGGRGGRGGGAPREDHGRGEKRPFSAPTESEGGSSQPQITRRTVDDLRDLLSRGIDGRQYPCYKDIRGYWNFGNAFTLHIHHVQGDAYASPSQCRVLIPHCSTQVGRDIWKKSDISRVATCDYLARRFSAAVSRAGGDVRMNGNGWKGAKGGEMTVDTPTQTILDRSAVIIDDAHLEARFTVALPASGRTIMGKMASTVLTDMLARYIKEALLTIDERALISHVQCAEDYYFLREVVLPRHSLVSFVANGSVLPRLSGASDAPMPSDTAIRFMSPSSMAVEIELPNRGSVVGMGIPKGVSLITGGGFHGKSTLLNAIVSGVYPHIPGDGRELVATAATAAKIRAEDGRRIGCVDISSFINNLPYSKSTKRFCTDDASGSTSQASNIIEALEAGSTCLLLDEDTCATNFMIRDARMQMLVSPDKEPITPFINRVRSLKDRDVSTVLVVGGCGDYFDVADRVIMMDIFVTYDVTERAREISAQFGPAAGSIEQPYDFPDLEPRVVEHVIDAGVVKISVRNKNLVSFGDTCELDLSCVEQLDNTSQTRAIVECLRLFSDCVRTPTRTALSISDLLVEIERKLDVEGIGGALDTDRYRGDLCRPRRIEVAAALNRLRLAVFR
ncbi:unnamed protein product [Ectocarpus fasciculatus]